MEAAAERALRALALEDEMLRAARSATVSNETGLFPVPGTTLPNLERAPTRSLVRTSSSLVRTQLLLQLETSLAVAANSESPWGRAAQSLSTPQLRHTRSFHVGASTSTHGNSTVLLKLFGRTSAPPALLEQALAAPMLLRHRSTTPASLGSARQIGEPLLSDPARPQQQHSGYMGLCRWAEAAPPPGAPLSSGGRALPLAPPCRAHTLSTDGMPPSSSCPAGRSPSYATLGGATLRSPGTSSASCLLGLSDSGMPVQQQPPHSVGGGSPGATRAVVLGSVGSRSVGPYTTSLVLSPSCPSSSPGGQAGGVLLLSGGGSSVGLTVGTQVAARGSSGAPPLGLLRLASSRASMGSVAALPGVPEQPHEEDPLLDQGQTSAVATGQTSAVATSQDALVASGLQQSQHALGRLAVRGVCWEGDEGGATSWLRHPPSHARASAGPPSTEEAPSAAGAWLAAGRTGSSSQLAGSSIAIDEPSVSLALLPHSLSATQGAAAEEAVHPSLLGTLPQQRMAGQPQAPVQDELASAATTAGEPSGLTVALASTFITTSSCSSSSSSSSSSLVCTSTLSMPSSAGPGTSPSPVPRTTITLPRLSRLSRSTTPASPPPLSGADISVPPTATSILTNSTPLVAAPASATVEDSAAPLRAPGSGTGQALTQAAQHQQGMNRTMCPVCVAALAGEGAAAAGGDGAGDAGQDSNSASSAAGREGLGVLAVANSLGMGRQMVPLVAPHHVQRVNPWAPLPGPCLSSFSGCQNMQADQAQTAALLYALGSMRSLAPAPFVSAD